MDFEKLKTAMGDLDEEMVLSILDEVMADGGSQVLPALDACQEGMNIIGARFEEGEYFVGDLIFAGELMTGAVDKMRSALVEQSNSSAGKVILCTVKDDMHDIGKNIVKSMLAAGGFDVVDLGIDTPEDQIINTAKEQDIHIIVLSGVLTLAIDSMKKTVDAFKDAGMRDQVKILIGGAPVNEEVRIATGADAWAYNPQVTVKTCLDWAKS